MDSSSRDEAHTNETRTNESQTIEVKNEEKKQRGITKMAKLTKVRKSDNKF